MAAPTYLAVSQANGSNAVVITSNDGVTWPGQPGAFNTRNWYPVTYAKGLFVAVSCDGSPTAVMTSPDGVYWTLQTTPNIGAAFDIIFAGGQFVAVGNSGIMTSPNAITWTLQSAPLSGIYSVAYGNGVYVVLCFTFSGQQIMTSPDAVTWTAQSSPADGGGGLTLTFGTSLFVALIAYGAYGTGFSMTSPDGVTWTPYSITYPGSTSPYFMLDVIYAAGQFVMVGYFGLVMTSPDGATWTAQTSVGDGLWVAITYGAGQYVAVGIDTSGQPIMTSSDAVNWTAQTPAVSGNTWQGVCSLPEVCSWVVAHDDSVLAGNIAMTSADAITWTNRNTPVSDSGETVAFGAGLYVIGAYGASSTQQIATSPDGITWTGRSTPADGHAVVKIIYGGGQFVALYYTVGFSQVSVMTSPNGITWTAQTVPTPTAKWADVTWVAALSLYVAVSGVGGALNEEIMTSPDAVTWTNQTVPAAGDWFAVAYGAGLVVVMGGVVGSGVHLMTSPDAVTWTAQADPAGSTQSWNGLIYAGSQFVAVGATLAHDHVVTSPDGLTWTIRTAAADRQWQSISRGGGLYLAVANDGSDPTHAVMTSPDAITWTLRTTDTAPYANGAAYACRAAPPPVVGYRNTWAGATQQGAGNCF